MKKPYSIYFSYVIVGCMCLVVGGFAGGIFTIGIDAIYWGTPVAENGQTRFQMLQVIVIGVGAIITLGFAGWRTIQGHQQTETAIRQAEIANKQAEIANQQAEVANRNAETANRQAENAIEQTKISRSNMQIDRYQKALEMIDAEKPIQTKLAGLRILETLANEDPQMLAKQVSYCFMDYVREGTKQNTSEYSSIATRQEFVKEKKKKNPPDITGHDIEYALKSLLRLRKTIAVLPYDDDPIFYDLSGVSIEFMILSGYDLRGCYFGGAWHNYLNIKNCDLTGASIRDFYGRGTLEACNLSGAVVLINDDWKIASCYFNPQNPPRSIVWSRPALEPRQTVGKDENGEWLFDYSHMESPFRLPPDFTGSEEDKENYFRTALELLDWDNREEDLAVLMAGLPFHGNETEIFREAFRAKAAQAQDTPTHN